MRVKLLAALVALAGAAQANTIILEPDNYAAGTNVSNVVAGIALSAVTATQQQGQAPVFNQPGGPVYSVEGGVTAVTGTRVLGADPTNPPSWRKPIPDEALDGPTLRADFVGGVTDVEFLWSDNECTTATSCGDMALMKLFDSSNHLIATCDYLENSLDSGCGGTALGFIGNGYAAFSATYHATNAFVAYAMIGGFVTLDRVKVDVPEPATLGLLGAGLLAIGLRRRRAVN